MNTEAVNHFIDKFNARLQEVQNQEYLIDNEIKQIELFISQPDKDPKFIRDLNFANETNSVFDFMQMGNPVYFNSVFNEYLINGKIEPILDFVEDNEILGTDINELKPTNDDFLKLEREEAILFAKYYEWLKQLKLKPTKKSNFSKLNNDQKLLALHFLGLDLRDFTKEQTAKVLSEILNIGSENIRRNLSILQGGKNNLRTPENFQKLLELFDNKTFDSIQNKIKKEIKDIT